MPSLGQIMGGAIAGIAGGIANAIKNNNKNSGSSSGGSSGSSSGNRGSGSGGSSGGGGSSGSGGSTYVPKGVYNDADLKIADPDAYNQIQQYKNRYNEAYKLGDQSGMQSAHDAAEAIRKGYGYSGGGDGSEKLDFSNAGNTAQVIAGVKQAAEEREEEARRQEDLINQQYEASLGQAIANMNAQKGEIGKLTKQNNAAAEKAYMQTLNPNGSLAENLAANGLLSSGVTETSQIQAGNAYQSALNNNALTEAEGIAEIDRMIEQARYTNDLERLQALQQLLQNISEMGYENAMAIAGLQQWGIENSQNYQMSMEQLELQKRQLEEDIANGKIDRQLGLKQIALIDEQIEEQQLTNRFNRYQLGRIGA